MKKIFKMGVVAIILPMAIWAGGDISPSNAISSEALIDGFGVSYGQSKDNIDIYRLYLRKDFKSRWLESDIGYLSGYWEASFNYWDGYGVHSLGVALSPVFTYLFNGSGSITPYLEGGIGISWFSKKQIGPRNLATHFLFEDRVGAGLRIGNWDISVRYMHYSNAGIKQPNSGIDIFIGSISYHF